MKYYKFIIYGLLLSNSLIIKAMDIYELHEEEQKKLEKEERLSEKRRLIAEQLLLEEQKL